MEHRIIKIVSSIAFLSMVGLIQSCYYDVEEELYPVKCNTTDVSYQSDVITILTNYGCISCHNSNFPSGGVNLDGYSNVKLNVDNQSMMSSMKHQTGFAAMPPSGPAMKSCDIDKIQSWIDDGARER